MAKKPGGRHSWNIGLGDALQKVLDAHDVEKRDAAYKAGISESQLSSLLAGRRRDPQISGVAFLLRAMNATWGDLDVHLPLRHLSPETVKRRQEALAEQKLAHLRATRKGGKTKKKERPNGAQSQEG